MSSGLGRASGRRRPVRRLALALATLLLAPAAPAGPQGASVVRGRVQLSRSGDVTTIHASHNSIINYRSFNIARSETVQFIQPSASSRVLNRITTPEPTYIDGRLLANGQVYIVNRAGVIFGKGCVVNVGAIVAAAASLSDGDFVAGIDRFTGAAGAVVNRGSIQADRVCLLGRTVENTGSIVAERGTIVMAAGKSIYLGRFGENVYVQIDGAGDGSIPESDAARSPLAAGDVFSLAVRHTGVAKAEQIVVAGGPDGEVKLSGWLEAVDRESHRGGTIRVLGGRVSVTGGLLDASGPNAGGVIEIGGDTQGADELPGTRQIAIAPAAVIRADATAQGDGGRVIVWARDAAGVCGEVSARGGPGGGDGGFVETSAGWLDVASSPDLSAPAGLDGTWLIDPYDIEIVNGMWSNDGWFGAYWTYESPASLTQISVETLLLALHTVRTVAVRTGDGGGGQGNITWNALTPDIELDAIGDGGSRRILLAAHNDITILDGALPEVDPGSGGVFQLVLIPDSDNDGRGEAHVTFATPRYATGTFDEWLVKPAAVTAPSGIELVLHYALRARPDLTSARDDDKLKRRVAAGDTARAMRAMDDSVILTRAGAAEPTTQPVAKGSSGPERAPKPSGGRAGGPEPTTRPLVAAGGGPRSSARSPFLAGDWLGLYLRLTGARRRSLGPATD